MHNIYDWYGNTDIQFIFMTQPTILHVACSALYCTLAVELVRVEPDMVTESSIPPPSSLDASSWSLIATASIKSSFVHPYTMAFKKPCRGTVRDCMEEGGRGRG